MFKYEISTIGNADYIINKEFDLEIEVYPEGRFRPKEIDEDHHWIDVVYSLSETAGVADFDDIARFGFLIFHKDQKAQKWTWPLIKGAMNFYCQLKLEVEIATFIFDDEFLTELAEKSGEF